MNGSRLGAVNKMIAAVLPKLVGNPSLIVDRDTYTGMCKTREFAMSASRDGLHWRGMPVRVVAFPIGPVCTSEDFDPVSAPTEFCVTIVVERWDNGRLDYFDHPENDAPFNTGTKVEIKP